MLVWGKLVPESRYLSHGRLYKLGVASSPGTLCNSIIVWVRSFLEWDHLILHHWECHWYRNILSRKPFVFEMILIHFVTVCYRGEYITSLFCVSGAEHTEWGGAGGKWLVCHILLYWCHSAMSLVFVTVACPRLVISMYVVRTACCGCPSYRIRVFPKRYASSISICMFRTYKP